MLMIITSALALFELCMLAYTSGALSEAAHEGLRFAIVNGSDARRQRIRLFYIVAFRRDQHRNCRGYKIQLGKMLHP